MKRRLSKKVAAVALSVATLMTVFISTPTYAVEYFSKGELIQNNTFDGGVGLPWHVVESFPAKADFDISGGTYKVTVKDKGTNRWDVQFRHRGLTIEQGHTYTVKYTIKSDKDTKFYPKIGQQGGDYKEYFRPEDWQPISLKANTPLTVTKTFTMSEATDKTSEFAFHIGGDAVSATLPITLTFDNIYVSDPQFPGYVVPPAEPTNKVRVNQEGYFPKSAKIATYVSSSTSALTWKLVNASGTSVATGQTKVVGADKSSGDDVHTIDFSTYQTVGTGYKLVVGTDESLPFDIDNDAYTKMKYDALKYYYHNRSGIEIKMPYCDRADLARPAGHNPDKLSPVEGSTNAGKYTLDITGGWYDAGDHGKYVVNGGISTWTVMNEYERALNLNGDPKATPLADNTLNIPESGNGIPDILDEARFNVQTLLKMQVPAGYTNAGMVHHKAHDERWTALAIRPDQDKQPRWLQPVSTAATYNLAAIAAQSSRLWKTYDSTFATTCLTAAETAWDAADTNPVIYATMTQGTGGGAYGDDNVTDEKYWAAAELYITTGKAKYLDFMKTSPKYLAMPSNLVGGEAMGLVGAFDWGNVAGLGTISLVTVPNGLPAADLATAKANIMKAADDFIAIENKQGYGVPIEERPIDATGLVGFPWGSNSFVVNNAIVMSYAYELSGRKENKYINGAISAMDYILGRNPMVQSYVTGYGDNPLENPHHRFWSYQADNTFPKAPGGCMSGGPNSGLQDPWVRGSGWGVGSRAPEKCFMDNIESWSTNEITINWNAPLAWMSAYLDERGPKIDDVVVGTLGDVNGDGSVNAIDFAVLKKYLLDSSTVINTTNADVNKDGAINAIDFALLKSNLLGKSTF